MPNIENSNFQNVNQLIAAFIDLQKEKEILIQKEGKFYLLVIMVTLQ